MAIDEDYHSTFEKVDTYEGENQPIQIWAKDQDSYEGIGSDKLGICLLYTSPSPRDRG